MRCARVGAIERHEDEAPQHDCVDRLMLVASSGSDATVRLWTVRVAGLGKERGSHTHSASQAVMVVKPVLIGSRTLCGHQNFVWCLQVGHI